MNITTVSPFLVNNQAIVQNKPKITPGEAQASFKTALSNAIKDVNELQNVSAVKTELLAKGEIDNLHDVMITGQKASITLQATVEVRNKVIEAYQEIMRMQV
ncbi:flagellar hook-basal body complex protein FliE [Halalkalibacter akibai]|uniref:Flagellar hook-basal body complex protein FliE n=1 Tax=Halalkalibacter akibai (strain ATCC 43226 / DSM 21942 / CIP 109018 / JCM 9157 / 1139) TaxID=1236973 RepID=W4QVV4_HALA3|nr:flagellar hook-basal body complex protein FliE [Halalkalibacter akibai]GAE36022.1 flagellar hook-basal body complex protein FliE [Halalkalibacter akibai JCM 9157]